MLNKKSKRRIRIRRVDALSSLRLAPLVAENEKTTSNFCAANDFQKLSR